MIPRRARSTLVAGSFHLTSRGAYNYPGTVAFSSLAAQRPVNVGTVATIPGREAAFSEFGRAAMPAPPHITQGREAAFLQFGRAAMPVPYLPVGTVAAYRRAAARQSITD